VEASKGKLNLKLTTLGIEISSIKRIKQFLIYLMVYKLFLSFYDCSSSFIKKAECKLYKKM
jgi:hypothetical protein